MVQIQRNMDFTEVICKKFPAYQYINLLRPFYNESLTIHKHMKQRVFVGEKIILRKLPKIGPTIVPYAKGNFLVHF